MTRIISGIHGGRRLATPTGDMTRPTSDRVREALFSRLEHLDAIDGAHVIDLYCGSGALGIEAMSRGAASLQLVDKDRGAAGIARRNVRELGLREVTIHQEKAETFLSGGGARRAHLVLIDPPYAVGPQEISRVLELLVSEGWLAEEALVVVERSSRSEPVEWPEGIEPAGEKRYGETMVWFGERAAEEPSQEEPAEG